MCVDIDLKNTAEERLNVTVTPDQCCLIIEDNDIDCEVLYMHMVCIYECSSYSSVMVVLICSYNNFLPF